MKRKVLFICSHNSARSQMAEAFLNLDHGERFEAHSAGVYPGSLLPEVVQAMSEIGIDISGHGVKSVEEFYRRNVPVDYAITVCIQAAEVCPPIPANVDVINWGFDDPSAQKTPEERLEVARRVRGEIRDAIAAWVKDLKEPPEAEKKKKRFGLF